MTSSASRMDGANAAAVAAQSKAPRLQWVDLAKGVCIVLVAFAHAATANHPDMSKAPAWVAWTYQSTLPLRMPLFFMMSGLFLWPAMAKGRRRFLELRFWDLVYPYVLWSVVTIVIESALASHVSSPLSMGDILLIPFFPVEQYWFLYALFALQMVALACYPSKERLLLAALLGMVAVQVLGGAWIGLRAFLFSPYLAVGVTFSHGLLKLSESGVRTQALVALVCGVAYCALYAAAPPVGNQFDNVLLGMTGAFSMAAIAMLTAHNAVALPLIVCGRASIAIFVLHSFVSAGTRIGMRLAGIDGTMLVAFAASVVIPVIVWHLRDRIPIGRWAGLGMRHSERPPTCAAAGVLSPS